MIMFGPSGNSNSFAQEGGKTTAQAAAWVKARGLDAYEYSFGRGIQMGEETAAEIGAAFRDAGVALSVHAPYYVNFASWENLRSLSSARYVIESAKVAKLMGANRVIFHPASQGRSSREAALERTIGIIEMFTDYVHALGVDDVIYCPETMGKLGQIGTLEEVVKICKIDNIFVPCVDFGHINAREHGSLKTEEDYGSRLDYLIAELGFERMKHFHVHFSKIQYGEKGEIRHLTFKDEVYGPEFPPLAAALKKRGLEPVIICESAGTQAEDAAEMKRIYNSL